MRLQFLGRRIVHRVCQQDWEIGDSACEFLRRRACSEDRTEPDVSICRWSVPPDAAGIFGTPRSRMDAGAGVSYRNTDSRVGTHMSDSDHCSDGYAKAHRCSDAYYCSHTDTYTYACTHRCGHGHVYTFGCSDSYVVTDDCSHTHAYDNDYSHLCTDDCCVPNRFAVARRQRNVRRIRHADRSHCVGAGWIARRGRSAEVVSHELSLPLSFEQIGRKRLTKPHNHANDVERATRTFRAFRVCNR